MRAFTFSNKKLEEIDTPTNCILIGPYADVDKPNAKCRIALGEGVVAKKDYEMAIGSREFCIRWQLTPHQWLRLYNALQDVFENAPMTEKGLKRQSGQ